MSEFNIYEEIKTAKLKDRLGWWEHTGTDDTRELVSVCMILCSKIQYLEKEVEWLKRMQQGKTESKSKI